MYLVSLGAVAILPLLAEAGVPHVRAVPSSTIAGSSTIVASSTSALPSLATPSPSGRPIFSFLTPIPTDSTNWTSVECTTAVTDNTLDPDSRWNAAGGSGAWNDLLTAWSTEGAASTLNFPEFASHFFAGPDNWNCQNLGVNPCSTGVTCNQVNHPAGYLILNSLSAINQVHAGYYQALEDALNDMQNYIGMFASTFSPQEKDNTAAIKILLDAIVMVAAIGSSFAWTLAMPALKVFEDGSKLYGISKDITNAAVNSFALAAVKDSLKSSTDALGTQNTLSGALGVFFDAWKQMETDYVKTLFAGTNDDDSNGALQKLVAAGDMLLLPSQLDQSGLSAQAEKILYGQLIPAAWSVAPGGLRPIIIRKEGACSTGYDQEALDFMSKDTLTGGYVCYNNDAFYVVNAQHPQQSNNPHYTNTQMPFVSLPGGTHSALDGSKWGGVILEDMVQSSWEAYQKNGNQNGYQMPDVSSLIDGQGTEGDFVFQNGIRTPGFFNLPICDGIYAAANAAINTQPGSKYWPCDNPQGYNPSGTKLHVNYGCVTVNDETKCASGSINIPDAGTDTTSATIYAKFNGDDKIDYKVVPGCKLAASWPRAYGDVYFGQDNCLYDSTGTQINGQCCTESTTDQVVNPYYNS